MSEFDHRCSSGISEGGRVRILTPTSTVDLLGAVKPLYEEVYAEDPYFEGEEDFADFVERWNYHIQQESFRVLLAFDEDLLVGFIYGIALSKGSQWWQGLIDDVDPDVVREDGQRTFAIIELVVKSAYRRNGVGAALHRRLLAGCQEERVTLLTRKEALPASAAYAAWGYSVIGRLRPGADAPVYLAMLRRLDADAS